LKIPNIFTAERGHSYFGEAELNQDGPNRRIQARYQDVLYWQMGLIKPGHFIDFTPSGTAQMVAIMSGRISMTVSNGEVRHFSRGDMVLLQDLEGRGHTTRVLGHEPCTMLRIAMPGKGEFK
jgi:gentisate 1,2-dioxygenase